jgi:transcription-repair coupling factor (superfamily II helicase)
MYKNMIKSPRIQALHDVLHKQDTILVEGLWNASKALTAAIAHEVTEKNILLLTGSTQEEARLFHDFALFTDSPVVDFPSWETLPSENIPPSPEIVGERYEVLRQLLLSKHPSIILTSLQACLQRLISPKSFQDLSFHVKKGESYLFSEIVEKLLKMGYQRKSIASDKGEFAVRGGIIDIFSISSPDPYRLEFFGDELDSLRIYDPIGQKSVRSVEAADFSPALELELLSQYSLQSSILDYLGPNTLIIFDDLLALEDRYASLLSLGSSHPYFIPIEEFLLHVAPLQTMLWSEQPIEELSEIQSSKSHSYYSTKTAFHSLSFSMFNRAWQVQRWCHPFHTISATLFPDEKDEPSGEELLARLPILANHPYQIDFLCANELEEETLRKRIGESEIVLPPTTTYQRGYLSSSLVIDDSQQVYFPFTEISHRYKIRRQKLRSTYHTSPVVTYDLIPGEMVVHLHHGLGRYVGMEKQSNHQGVLTEFFAIEYANQAKIYVPLNQAHFITKYIGSTEESPRLHVLGGGKWKKLREQTEEAVLGYAADLLENYAKRAMKQGFIYPADSHLQKSFEEDFPFSETEDQLAAIHSLKEDMQSSKVMDRLICGDVGYGKTEVAMRAAFKAVVDGKKQVAVLVPTTVLAMQHYENFVQRMMNFPIKIGVIARFRTPRQVRETLREVAEGNLDILIGTHRLISDDVFFQNLGLVIIDEEQRFGVKAKEHLKKRKLNVDCLTLSATPIPRTLYMSLMGARDMSVINTPPQDRLPIKTVIAEPHDEVYKTALLRELSRDGQAFIIHNRVETIYGLADRIKKIVPQARILVAHGQMEADEIDTTFHAFKNGQADILIATTIVENGIDIPNANTILIDRADHFGLASLYQLRGRVGRWNRRAYAYFLVRNLPRVAQITLKRLQALVESSGYGGGMKIAMHDLEIRGAGNILGEEQSGHVISIGFHLYCKLLNRAMKKLQGKLPNNLTDPKIELPIDARLPEEYIPEVYLRMEIYQRLGESLSWEEIDLLWEEMKDRFGQPPPFVLWLYHLSRIRVYASLHGIILIKQEKSTVTIEKQARKEVKTKKISLASSTYSSAKEMENVLVTEIKSWQS